ncbi:hypothetical protein [uncultured Phascolarctobacterium sp.]|uniref:hypothetical protein n=1 Tax=uncultured Phascolarctobacterium sp. TaxID=512296 RepID=UPI0025DD4F5D|nr:hypothetical protein [uncultured Phascolarctobacterium sp.]
MGRANRAMRRKANREIFKSRISLTELHEAAAEQYARDVTREALSTAIAKMNMAIAMTVIFNYGSLNKKSTRLATMIDTMHYYVRKINANDLSEEEQQICGEIRTVLEDWYKENGAL